MTFSAYFPLFWQEKPGEERGDSALKIKRFLASSLVISQN